MLSKMVNPKIIAVFIAVLFCPVFAEQIKVKAVIDPRVELMSVVFHLAGNDEYNKCKSRQFMSNLNEHFKKYKDHPAVKKAAELRSKYGVSYDAVMSMAVHIKDVNSCAELISFEPQPETLDSRWQIDEARDFLDKCRSFVRDTDFNAFLRKNQLLYDTATQRLQYLVDRHARFEWFDEYFGTKSDKQFNLVISILNGTSSYGTRVKLGDKMQIYSILGVWDIKWFGWGKPAFSPGVVSTIVHEFAHSYCNPLMDKYMDRFEGFGKKFYDKYEKQMQNQAYGSWQTMMYESLVRVCEVRYAMATSGPELAQHVADYQVTRGFVWTTEFSQLFDEYEQHRDKYPTLESFMPRIIEFFEEYKNTND